MIFCNKLHIELLLSVFVFGKRRTAGSRAASTTALAEDTMAAARAPVAADS